MSGDAMRKAMISQPMAGKTDEEIVATRERAIDVLTERGFDIVNTLFTDEWYSKKSMIERGVVQIPLCFLAKSLENMSLCHAAYFCEDWELARGCRIEHDVAVAYGLEIIYEKGAHVPPTIGSFGWALEAMNRQEKVRRLGWNGKGQFVVLMPALYLPPFNTQDTARKVNDRTAKWIGEDKPLDSQPYFALFNTQMQWQPGWVPSTADCLAGDWEIAED